MGAGNHGPEGDHRHLDGGELGLELEDNALFPVRKLLPGEGLGEEGQDPPVHPGGRFNHVGDEPLPRLGVAVGEALGGVLVPEDPGGDPQGLLVLGVAPQVKVRAVGDALELFQAVGEAVEDVHGGLGVVGELLRGLLVGHQVLPT